MIINLHGRLGKKYGNRHSFKVRNSKDAIEALNANFPGFKQQILSLTQKGIYYKAVKDKEATCKNISDYYEKCEEIDIVPSVIGSGVGGLIVGGGLITAIGTFAEISYLVYIGIAMILQGVMLLLFPFEFEGTQEAPLETVSYIFSNTDNNAVQGFRIPIIYGQTRVGSNVISTNIDAFDITKQLG
jgi:predicted phage tail protein